MKNYKSYQIGKYRVVIFQFTARTDKCAFCNKPDKGIFACIYSNGRRLECCYKCRSKYGLDVNVLELVKKAITLLKIKGKI